MNPPVAVASSAPFTRPAQRRSGVRDTRTLYDAQQFGCFADADDGSELDNYGSDRRGSDYVWSSAWMETECRCIRPQFRHRVRRDRLSACRQHGYQAPPEIDPSPLSPREREEIEDRIWMPLAARLEVPNRFRLVSFERSQETVAVRAVRDFLDDGDNEERCLALLGQTGTGKTTAAFCGVRREAVWSCDPDLVVYWEMKVLARKLLASQRDDGDGVEEIIEACREADLLFIDDIGGTYVKEGGLVEASMEDIICGRHGDQLQTILTSNLPAPDLMEALGDRVADRMRDWGVIVSVPGPSLRRKPAGGRG